MKTIIVANWKMNPVSKKEAKKLFEIVKTGIGRPKNLEVIICPPFVFLSDLKGLKRGAQNLFYKEKGAFTGEISALMLSDLDIKYVILGHSERRNIFFESDEEINKKIKTSFQFDIIPIFCVGEKEGENKQEVLERQVERGLEGLTRENVKKVIIAYEPVFAIGTGKNCSIDETLQSVLLIRKIISGLYSREVANKVQIIYGGSVNSGNSAEYIKNAGVSGLLVGSASLDAKEFIKIVKSVIDLV